MTLRTGRVEDLSTTQDLSKGSDLASIAKCAEKLTNGKGWPDGVQELLAELGIQTGANVVWIFQMMENSDDHLLMDYPFEWSRDPSEGHKSKPRFNLLHWDFAKAGKVYNEMVASRKRGEWQSLIVPEMDDCPLKRDLSLQGVKSMLTFPIMVEGEWWGLLGLDEFDRIHRWPDQEIALVCTATYMLSNAILQDRLASKKRQYEILENITESSAWELDLNTGHLWCAAKAFSSHSNPTDNMHLSLYETLRRTHKNDRRPLMAELRQHMRGTETTFRKDLRILRDGTTYVWVEIIAQIAVDHRGKLQKLSGIVIEIPERKAEEERLRRRADVDPLTGIANRRHFDVTFTQYAYTFHTDKTAFSLLIVDIDHFKNINDTWGHSVGDIALKHVASILQKTLRDCDSVARIGGEEFAILTDCESPSAAQKLAERIRQNIENTPLIISGSTIPLTISIGIACQTCDAKYDSHETMFTQADAALYQAKRDGRNKVITAPPLYQNRTCQTALPF